MTKKEIDQQNLELQKQKSTVSWNEEDQIIEPKSALTNNRRNSVAYEDLMDDLDNDIPMQGDHQIDDERF